MPADQPTASIPISESIRLTYSHLEGSYTRGKA